MFFNLLGVVWCMGLLRDTHFSVIRKIDDFLVRVEPRSTDTRILRKVSFVLTKISYTFFKINPLKTGTAGLKRRTDTFLC